MSSCYPTQDAYGLICFPFFPFGSRASKNGLVKIDHTGRVLQFFEKPKGADLNSMVRNSLCNPILLFSFLS
jgi:ADP-glucose pyrophosphorylase